MKLLISIVLAFVLGWLLAYGAMKTAERWATNERAREAQYEDLQIPPPYSDSIPKRWRDEDRKVDPHSPTPDESGRL